MNACRSVCGLIVLSSPARRATRRTIRPAQWRFGPEPESHADPRTTMRYARARASLDRHATYPVAAYLAGAAR
jgi:hypothetical protein